MLRTAFQFSLGVVTSFAVNAIVYDQIADRRNLVDLSKNDEIAMQRHLWETQLRRKIRLEGVVSNEASAVSYYSTLFARTVSGLISTASLLVGDQFEAIKQQVMGGEDDK